MNCKLVIQKIYEKYNPAKVDDIPLLLERSGGKEDELLKRICEKYGVSDDEVSVLIEAEFQKQRRQKIVLRSWIVSLVFILISLIIWDKFVKGQNPLPDKRGMRTEEQKEPNVQRTSSVDSNDNSAPQVDAHESERSTLSDDRSDYQVASERAYFFDKPEKGTQRKAYLVKGENLTIFNDDFSSEFVYVEFVNAKGRVSIGWILRSDLEFLETE